MPTKILTKNIIKRKLRDAMIFLKQPVCGCKKCLGSKEAATVLWDKEKSETLWQGCCVRGRSAVSHLPQSWHGESKTAAQNHGIDAMSWLGMSFGILLVKALHWNHPAFCTLGMQEPKLLYQCYISDFSCFLALKMQSSPQLYTPSELIAGNISSLLCLKKCQRSPSEETWRSCLQSTQTPIWTSTTEFSRKTEVHLDRNNELNPIV